MKKSFTIMPKVEIEGHIDQFNAAIRPMRKLFTLLSAIKIIEGYWPATPKKAYEFCKRYRPQS